MSVKEKRVKDIMTPIDEYSSVSVENTVGEAIAILKKSFCPDSDSSCNGHRSVLVYDKSQLVGLVTFRVLLTAIEPRFMKVDQWALPVFWEGLFTERCKEEARKKVKEIMTPLSLITLDAEDTIIKAIHAMIKHKLGSLPVVKDGVVVGMVRITEIFNEISSLVTKQPEVRETKATQKGAISY